MILRLGTLLDPAEQTVFAFCDHYHFASGEAVMVCLDPCQGALCPSPGGVILLKYPWLLCLISLSAWSGFRRSPFGANPVWDVGDLMYYLYLDLVSNFGGDLSPTRR